MGVAKAWEEAFFADELPGTRRAALRTAIVLGRGSVLKPLFLLTRLGLGGAHLDGHWPATRARLAAGTYHAFRARRGRQKYSWVHLADVLGVIEFLRSRPDLDGVFNVSSPNPTDDRTFMAVLRRVLGVPFGLPQPRWMLELGAIGIRTETELVLKSRWVLLERLLAEGYRFRFPDLEPALRNIIESSNTHLGCRPGGLTVRAGTSAFATFFRLPSANQGQKHHRRWPDYVHTGATTT